jgi:hypothetical protein
MLHNRAWSAVAGTLLWASICIYRPALLLADAQCSTGGWTGGFRAWGFDRYAEDRRHVTGKSPCKDGRIREP